MREPFSCAPPTARAHFNVMQDSFTFGERKIRLSIIHTPVLMDIQSLFLKGTPPSIVSLYPEFHSLYLDTICVRIIL